MFVGQSSQTQLRSI